MIIQQHMPGRFYGQAQVDVISSGDVTGFHITKNELGDTLYIHVDNHYRLDIQFGRMMHGNHHLEALVRGTSAWIQTSMHLGFPEIITDQTGQTAITWSDGKIILKVLLRSEHTDSFESLLNAITPDDRPVEPIHPER